ncbi:MAG: hypothetical protein LBU22_03970 [Dysgonamonadaceae bacterium]|jgi:lipid II:glycine glycyltransferase (peptidoglycan interpeptide bridge formation enzyme)|nr:hypothetical protein [Dysgonamonadaceae bacterium]
MFEVITAENKGKWNEIVCSMKRYDFYHLAEYHLLDATGTPLLLYYRNKASTVALPVILRPIEGTPYHDINSVYGYVGPLTNLTNPDTSDYRAFQQELRHFFDTHSIVSAFARMHPLFSGQEKIIAEMGEIIDTNMTVCINLKLPEDEQKRQYSHSLKNRINRLKRKNLTVRISKSRADIDLFINTYQENMERVHASKMYFFSKDYFHQFIETIPSALLLAFYEDEIIGGSLFTECNGIVQTHLSASRNKYLYLSPMKYIWDYIRIIAKKKNMDYLHLGGGVGGQNDSLFAFKSQFSKQYLVYKTWRYIHNQAIYDELLHEKFGNNIPPLSYFPLYRTQ